MTSYREHRGGDDGNSNSWNIPLDAGFSWTAQILPFAEQVESYDRMAELSERNGVAFASYPDFARDVSWLRDPRESEVNDETIDTVTLPWAVCPSWKNKSYRAKKAQCVYRANGGKEGLSTDDGPMKHKSFSDRGTGSALGQISDGLSKTALIWERNDNAIAKYIPPYRGNAVNDTRNKTPYYAGRKLSLCAYEKDGADGDPIQITAASTNATFSGPNPNSDHKNGVFGVLMADGSVRFLDPNVTNGVWRALCIRNDGQ